MLKYLLFISLCVANIHCDNAAVSPNGEPRLCPDNYHYAGDDTPRYSEIRDVWLEEADRSPTYSCYKLVLGKPINFFKARHDCEEDKGHLVSIEDTKEVGRLMELYYDFEEPVLTSGLMVEDEWNWMGSNETFHEDLFQVDIANGSCLSLSLDKSGSMNESFVTVSCYKPMNYICEMRVQTVTYYAWFVANWFSILLVFLVIVLLVSLCVSTTIFRRRSSPAGRVYRSQHVFDDHPPSYSRATGQNRYLNKGREFLAKVTINQKRDDGSAGDDKQ